MTLATKPRPSLESQHFQVAIIGGGINGVALARECARAGKRTLLVEQNDFAKLMRRLADKPDYQAAA